MYNRLNMVSFSRSQMGGRRIHTIWELAERLSRVLETPHNVAQACCTPEVLLLEAKCLTLVVVVIGVKHVCDVGSTVAGLYCALVITRYEVSQC